MTDLFADIALIELLVRMMATAFIVIVVATAVGKLGPIFGGLVAGLPIGFGPGFYFLLDDASSDFLVQAATFSLLALSATQIFLGTYIATARQDFPIASLSVAALLWVMAIAMLSQFTFTTVSAAALFVGVTLVTYRIGLGFKLPKTPVKRKEGVWVLVSRACVAGFLVAVVTLLAPKLGAELSGILLAFPIGYAFISITVHRQYGKANVIDVLHSALLGTIGLASFCAAFALYLQSLSEIDAFLIGLTASLAVTSLLILGSLVRRQ